MPPLQAEVAFADMAQSASVQQLVFEMQMAPHG